MQVDAFQQVQDARKPVSGVLERNAPNQPMRIIILAQQ